MADADRLERLSLGLVVLLLVGLLIPAVATAAWTSPVNLSAAGENASSPRVAVDPDGDDAVLAWLRSDGSNDRLQARARSAADGLSAVQTLSASGQSASDPQVAVDIDGDAVFAWQRSDGSNNRVQARVRSAAGVLSPVVNVSPAGQNASRPQIAVDADGDAIFIWGSGSNFRVQARTRSAAGALGALQNVSPAGQFTSNPSVDVDSNGDAVIAWEYFDGTNFRIRARARSAAGGLSSVQTLSAAGQDASSPRVAVDPDGDAVLAWLRSDGSNERLQARARSAADGLSAVQTLSASGQSASDPGVAVDADGDAVFAWRRSDGTNFRIQTRVRSAAGVLSSLQNLSPGGLDGAAPWVDVDATGDAVFTWASSDGASDSLVQSRSRSASSGTLSPIADLSNPTLLASEPQVAVDAVGDAVATWRVHDGTNYRAQASTGP